MVSFRRTYRGVLNSFDERKIKRAPTDSTFLTPSCSSSLILVLLDSFVSFVPSLDLRLFGGGLNTHRRMGWDGVNDGGGGGGG